MEFSKKTARRIFTEKDYADSVTPSNKLLDPLTPMPKLTEYLRRYSIELNFSNFSLHAKKKKTPVYSPGPRPSSLLLNYLSLPLSPPKSFPNLKNIRIQKNMKSNTEDITKHLQRIRKKV